MRDRTITLLAHTHWDREWYEPFEVMRARAVEVIDEALEVLEGEPGLRFTLDGQVALLDDYLEVRPEALPRARALVEAGRLFVGPFYTQAETMLTDGEALVRNLAAGIARANELGGAMRVGYMADQFGHAAQMPQLLSLFGISSAMLWRGVGPERAPHVFAWRAPDGTIASTTWLQDGYGSGRRFPSEPRDFVAAVTRHLERLDEWLGDAPLALPIGDDHVRLPTWLPRAAEALAQACPNLSVGIGGPAQHVALARTPTTVVSGELRASTFAPVLAAVASARTRDKQAAYRATRALLRYAEPLTAWLARLGGRPPTHLIQLAWRYLVLNQAHDSAAGCGTDVCQEDVRARYRWAEQLAVAARDQVLAQLGVEGREDAHVVHAFVPADEAASITFEADVPRWLGDDLVAVGRDGRARRVQPLSSVERAPVFEGEFAAAELGQYLMGLDPATPLFDKYLTGLTVREGDGSVAVLDVGLSDAPAPAHRLAADQERLAALLSRVDRFKIVVHDAVPTHPMLIQTGPGVAGGIVRATLSAAPADADMPRAWAIDRARITNGAVAVLAHADGTVTLDDGRRRVRANDLVNEGDRGDLYHAEPVGAPLRAIETKVSVLESGPVRATLCIEQVLTVPTALAEDRRARRSAQ
jgi:alpha-mannosidase